ncbi:MAG: hypothetical protein LBC40_04045, partial [Dysgonamonadaceae bacterium]|nr:hypothetical protein [Dysgonamonadaceae bacterium]
MPLTNAEKQELLNAIKAESQSVDELQTVSSLAGVNSLPALKGTQAVLVPLSLLSQPATNAAEAANQAAAAANNAATQAAAASETAADAASAANEAAEEAGKAAEEAAQALSDFPEHAANEKIHIQDLGNNPDIDDITNVGYYFYSTSRSGSMVKQNHYLQVVGSMAGVMQIRYSSHG